MVTLQGRWPLVACQAKQTNIKASSPRDISICISVLKVAQLTKGKNVFYDFAYTSRLMKK